MVKADPKRNYYADLELSPSANTEDIKKQFRKLARLYHPDRNPGQELEFVPKFQSIQAAHEILADPSQRAKYDADRKRLGYGARATRPPFTSAQTTTRHSRPFFTTTQPPPEAPRPPPPPPRPHRPPPPYPGARHPNHPPPPTAHASTAHTARPSQRFSGVPPFTGFQPPRNPVKEDVDFRNVSSAWASMGQGHARPTPSPQPQASGRDHGPFGKASTARPGPQRSYTTKSPRKSGFDPSDPGDFWEPPAPGSSAYNTRNHIPNPAQPIRPENPYAAAEEPQNPYRPSPARETPKRHSHDSLHTSTAMGEEPYFGQRLRTPYQSSGAGEKLHVNAGDFLRRSASHRDAPQAGARFEVPDSSSSPSSRNTTPTGKSSSPNDKQHPSHDKKQPRSFQFVSSDSESSTSEKNTKSQPGPNTSGRPKATPSRKWTRSPSKNQSQESFNATQNQSSATSSGMFGQPQSDSSGQQRMFNVPSNDAAPESRPDAQPSVNTDFSAEQWKGKFEGHDAFMPPPSASKNSRSRTSPTRAAQPPNSTPLPDPFPKIFTDINNPPPKDGATSPVKFSADVWEKTFKGPSFVIPDPSTMASQTTRPTSTAGRKGSRSRAMSKSDEKHPAKRAESQPPLPSQDTDAMDIDSDIFTPAKGAGPSESKNVRNVPARPHREWRNISEAKPTTTAPSAIPLSQKQVPQMPTAVPNAGLPAVPPPPPGPPPQASARPIKLQTEVKASSLNLESLGANLTARTGTGVADLNDLSTTLPFQSRASLKHPNALPSGPLRHPKPPFAPTAPNTRRLTQEQYKEYMSAISVYMGDWYIFEDTLLSHFSARHAHNARFGTGPPNPGATALLAAQGVVEDGVEQYVEALKQDAPLHQLWANALMDHQKCVAAHIAFKNRMNEQGQAAVAGR